MTPVRSSPTLGIDFGTSNCAAAWAAPGGSARAIPLEGAATTLPTAIFFNAEERSTHFGRDAITHYLAGTEGRLMRSLKSLLGSSLLQEKTVVGGHLVSYQEVIASFLAELKLRAERHAGAPAGRLVLGRPVHFVDDDPQRDRQAQTALLQAAKSAGFSQVSFQLEPIAAAFDYERRITREQLVLIVDIGGGTSDFTVVRLGPERIRDPAGDSRASDILATGGVHLGGTDFDQKLSLEQVMPLLGFRHTGATQREVPSAVFFDLSTWHLINWRYAPAALRDAAQLRSSYSDPRLHQRLMRVLELRLGHQLAGAVEQAKIACSSTGGPGQIDLGPVEAGLSAEVGTQQMAGQLRELLARVVRSARECVRSAGLPRHGIGAIYLTGGSSALAPFQRALQAEFSGTALVEGDLFGGVAAGLAYS